MTNILFLCIIIILFGFCCYFFIENTKLKNKIIELEEENKSILERRIIKNKSTDQVAIQTISDTQEFESFNATHLPNQSKASTISRKEQNISSTKEEIYHQKSIVESNKQISKPVEYIKENKKNITTIPNSIRQESINKISSEHKNSSNIKPTLNNYAKVSNDRVKNYQKNTISTHSNITSPVSLSNKENNEKQDAFDMNKLTLDLNEFIKKSEKVVPKIKEKPPHPDYLKEISEKMANELKPQTIELTDYEKAQEEHAIISYQELLALKDRLTIIDDDEGTVNFIEELKNLRNRLN